MDVVLLLLLTVSTAILGPKKGTHQLAVLQPLYFCTESYAPALVSSSHPQETK